MVRLSQEDLTKIKFKSGKYQYKLLDQNHYPVGSGTLLHYRERCFVVTCKHCLNSLDDPANLVVPILFLNGQVRAFNLRNFKYDRDIDLAAYEVSYVDLSGTQNSKDYITDQITDDIDLHPVRLEEDLIILHATNFFGVERVESNEMVKIDFNTLPYFTVITNYENDFFEASVNPNGLGEDGETHDILTLGGMSGSPVFRIVSQEDIRWLGLLTNGDPKAGICYIIDYKTVLEFIESKYFFE